MNLIDWESSDEEEKKNIELKKYKAKKEKKHIQNINVIDDENIIDHEKEIEHEYIIECKDLIDDKKKIHKMHEIGRKIRDSRINGINYTQQIGNMIRKEYLKRGKLYSEMYKISLIPGTTKINKKTVRIRTLPFKDRFKYLGLKIVKSEPDGNCFFHSVSYFVEEDHLTIREKVCNEIESNKKLNSQIIDLDDYIKDLRKKGNYGDTTCAKAVANIYNMKVTIFDECGYVVHCPDGTEFIFRNKTTNAFVFTEIDSIMLCFQDKHYDSLIYVKKSK